MSSDFVSRTGAQFIRAIGRHIIACVAVFSILAGTVHARGRLPPEPSLSPLVNETGVARMQNAIDYYRRIVSSGGWPSLPRSKILKLGDSGEAVAALRRRLQMSGDLRAESYDAYLFDETLQAAVIHYQKRNGLEPTGKVYGITQRLLNVPAATRLRQLEVNLSRMRELLPKISGVPRYIIMNSARFESQGIENGRVAVASRTIAGKRQTPTPVVDAAVRAINILPYWHVPRSIAKAHLIPEGRKDPSYFYRQNIRVFSTFGGEEIDPSRVNWFGPEAQRYVFRQDPGPQNALGVLRFDMPNKHIVYMHDTPMKNLFNYFECAYSSGCVRTQSYLDLAQWVLAGQDGWTKSAIQSAIASRQPKTIRLANPVPVHFVYLTAWVEGDAVNFRNDLYNRDDRAFDGGEDILARPFTTVVSP